MLYDQVAIDRIGESKIWESIKRNDTYTLTSKKEEEQLFIRAVESYIVKYYDKFNSVAKKKVDELIDSIFTIYSRYPHMATYSEILGNPKIVKLLSENNPERRKLYSKGFIELQKNFKKIYTKIMSKQKVEEEEKNLLFAYFIQYLKTNRKDNTVENCMKHIKDKILKKDEVPTNEQEKLFIMYYTSYETLRMNGFSNEDITIRLVDFEDKNECFLGGHELNSFLNMNNKINPDETFYHSLHQILQCVSYETIHRVQELEAEQDPNSINGMEMAFQKKFVGDDYRRGHNYIFNEIEEDADQRGFLTTALIYDRSGNKKLGSLISKEEREKQKYRNLHIEYVTTIENGEQIRVNKEKYNTENIRRTVKENKELLKKYPSLKHLFTLEGEPKTLEEMLQDRFISRTIDKMHKDLIIHDIRHNKLRKISFNGKTDEELRITIRRLNDILTSEIDKTNSLLDDLQIRKNKNYNIITQLSFEIRLMTIIQISTFINRNKDLILAYDKKYKNKNSDLYGDYSYRIRTLMNKIEEHKRNNTIGNLYEIVKKYEPHLKKMDNDIKREYMEFIKSHFSQEDLETRVHFGNRTISLKRFIDEEIFNHMDRNHYLHKNDGTFLKDSNGQVVISVIHYVEDILKNNKIKISLYQRRELNNMFVEDNIYYQSDKKIIA